MKISSITIVGNGLDLWMTSALLLKRCPQFKINIIDLKKESTDKNITVSEIFSLYSYLVGLDDLKWKENTNAVYRAGTEYYNFAQEGHYFCMPNSHYEIPKPNKDENWNLSQLFDLKNYYSNKITHKDLLNFITYTPWLIAQNRLTESFETTKDLRRPFSFNEEISFSFEKNLFADLLKEIAISTVNVYENSNPNITHNEDGSIQSIDVDSITLYSDLYIDVSSNSILVQKEESNPFLKIEKFHEDSKDVFVLPYQSTLDQVKNVKLADSIVGTDFGFAKKVPAWERCSFEYFYNSNETNQNEIEKIIQGFFEQEVEHSHQEVVNGTYALAWSNNVLSLGHAYMKLENKIVDSTSYLIDSLVYLLNVIDKNITHYDISLFNTHCRRNFLKSIDNDLIFNAFCTRKGKFWEYYNSFEYFTESVEYNIYNLLTTSNSNILPKDLFLLLGFDVSLFNSKFQTNIIAEKNKDFVKFLDYLKFGYDRFMEQMFEEVKTFENVHDYTVANIYT